MRVLIKLSHSDFKLDKKYENYYIYDNWRLPMYDQSLMNWIESIDPKFYEILSTKHKKPKPYKQRKLV